MISGGAGTHHKHEAEKGRQHADADHASNQVCTS